MAVQAQHPSHVLLLNRNVQEGLELDRPLQPQQLGGEFLDQTHMLLFSNGASSSTQRKRGREVSTATNIAGSINFPVPFQQNPLQLIDLSQLHNHQSNAAAASVSTGLRLSVADQQQQNSLFHSSPFSSLLSSDDFAAQIKRHREEAYQLLRAQGEQLRRTLSDQRQKHCRALIGAAGAEVGRRMREKEAEVEKATRRNAELESRAAQLTVEAQVWQAKAKAYEASTAALQAQLQQAIISGGRENRMAVEEGIQAEDAGSTYIDPDRAVVTGPSCKACRRRVATVVLLPCRHLSVCTECDRAAPACPVCFCSRNSSVEVYL